MTRSYLTILAALCLATVACGSDGAPPGTDPPLGAGPYPVADLRFDLSHPDRQLMYQISCQGDTATDIGDEIALDAEAACRALGTVEVADLLVAGPAADRVCTEIYGGPDVATIIGTLGGVEVDVVIDRTNGCGINDWDVVLAGVLPAAVGATELDAPNEGPNDEAGNVVRLWVRPERVDCVGVGPQKCLQVARSEDGDDELFYSQIEGFDFEEGTSYVIDVEVTDVDNPPADASSLSYRLIEVIEQS